MRRVPGVLLSLLIAVALTAEASAASLGRGRPERVDLGAVRVTDGASARSLGDVLPEGPGIIHLWATWCVPCRDELPALADFASTLSDRGMGGRLVLVSVDRGKYARVRDFLRELDLPQLHSWQEAGRSAGTVFRVFGYPTTLVFDAQHRLVVRHAGALEWDDRTAQKWLISFLASAE